MERYDGLDSHARSCTLGVMSVQVKSGWPDRLLGDVAWDFEGRAPYGTVAVFMAAVRGYALEMAEDAPPDADPWQPDAPVLEATRLVLRYLADPDDVEIWHETVLKSPSGRGFTAAELLLAVHNAVVVDLSRARHHWFEGVDLVGVTPEGVPIYELIGGS